jgi:hypothetical protein
MLLVQEYLLTHTLKELQDNHGVYAKFSKCGLKWSLNYDMLQFKSGDKLAEQCRGTVLRLASPNYINLDTVVGETKILAYPLNKFYNHGEGAAAKIDFSQQGIKVWEKLDGTLIVLHFDDITNAWHTATRSVCEADVPLYNDGSDPLTFRKLFEQGVKQTLGQDFATFTSRLNKTYTYCFELTSPYNRVFCLYPEVGITLLAVRNLETLEELDIHSFGFPVPKSWDLTSLEAIQEFVNSCNPVDYEGAVVTDGKFNRLKIKNVSWITGNSLKESVSSSPRNLLRCVLQGKEDDVVSVIAPVLAERLMFLKGAVAELFAELDQNVKVWKVQAETRKDFAILVEANAKWSAPCYQMYLGKEDSVYSYVRGLISKNKLSDTMIDGLLKVLG